MITKILIDTDTMQPVLSFTLPCSTEQAIHQQQVLAKQVITTDQLLTSTPMNIIAGVDVAYCNDSNVVFAAVVLLDARTLDVIETVTTQAEAQFPYIAGLFSFRELPALIQAFAKLNHRPDLVVCDGQGIAHPRRCGLASHLGLLYDLPSIGCGKNRLMGEHDDVHNARGDFSLLKDNDDVIGAALRTQSHIKPVYVSIGHKISLEHACDIILKLSSKYRLPQTTRLADQAVNRARKAYLSQQDLSHSRR